MSTRSDKWALVALIAVTLTASGVLGCNQDNGQNTADDVFAGADNGSTDCPSYLRKADGTCPLSEDDFIDSSDAITDDSVATETTEVVAPDPCKDWVWLGATTWVCYWDGGTQRQECSPQFWEEEDEWGVEHCMFSCSAIIKISVDHPDLIWGENSVTLIDTPNFICEFSSS